MFYIRRSIEVIVFLTDDVMVDVSVTVTSALIILAVVLVSLVFYCCTKFRDPLTYPQPRASSSRCHHETIYRPCHPYFDDMSPHWAHKPMIPDSPPAYASLPPDYATVVGINPDRDYIFTRVPLTGETFTPVPQRPIPAEMSNETRDQMSLTLAVMNI